MARTRTIRRSPKRAPTKRKKTKRKNKKQFFLLRILPDSLQAFIARRFVDGFALVSVLAGLFTGLALLTYNAQDPSWNTARSSENQDIYNWMGESGAFISDILLQTLGAGALLFSAVFIIWGIRAFNRQIINPLWLRTIALLFGAVMASIALSQVPSGNWMTHPYMGGSLGTLALTKIGLAGQGITPWLGPVPLTLIAGVLGLTAALYAGAIKLAEIGYLIHSAWFLLSRTVLTIIGSLFGFQNWLRHHNDPDYRPDPLSIFSSLKGFPKIERGENAAEKTKRTAPKITNTAAPKPALPQSKDKAPETPAQTNIPVVTPKAGTGAKAPDTQKRFSLEDAENWELPDLNLLESAPPEVQENQLDEKALRRNAELLQNVLADFNIEGEITSIHPGPVVTLYELEPAPGTKSAKVISLADDIARSMSAISVRVAVVPGRNVIGIELPNKNRQFVYMQEILASSMYEKTKTNLPLALGKDIGGQPILADLAKMPHLLVAGTTGSGKSVAVNTMILSLLFRLSPEKCRFIMIDPKMLELSVYDGIPHLLAPVVTEPGKAVVALKWTVAEMEERYRAMSKLGVRNIDGYNERVREAAKKGETIMQKVQTGFDETGKPVFEDQPMDLAELPFIVVIVDEFADLMLVAGKDVENAIQRLAQMARAAGIHLIMATQRPSVDVITGVIKANFPTRISFQVTSKVDSRTILGEGGAEQLLGMGDMLYMAPGGRITRVHGPFVSDEDVEKVVNDLKSQAAQSYIESITDGDFSDASEVMQAIFDDRSSGGEKVDELYDEAVAIVAREGKASTSYIQRCLQIGYNRAARIIEEMERQGVVSKANATGKREVLVSDFSDAG
ncbi:MAG: DNA translocase FtsK 4TM domain-containing protein [Pseudomonadota bacterium]